MTQEQRDHISGHYQAMASNASVIAGFLQKLHAGEDFSEVLQIACDADAAVQRLHDALGCMTLRKAIAERDEQNAVDRELLRETQAKLSREKRKKK